MKVTTARLDRMVWREIHRALEQRMKSAGAIALPDWAETLATMVNADNIEVRRYHLAFISAWQSVALLRSFQPERVNGSRIEANFEDFAIAQLLFEPVFRESLHRETDANYGTRIRVERLVKSNGNQPIGATELKQDMKVTKDKAYRLLREAADAGVIERANKPEQTNRKLYRPVSHPAFIPDPRTVFERIPVVGDHFRFLHPLSGKLLEFGPRGK